MGLLINRAKPNPFGRTRIGAETPTPESLLGEWVEVKNIGPDSIHFSTIQIRHLVFDPSCYATGESECCWQGGSDEYLKPHQTLRIHTGRESDAPRMPEPDRIETDWHGYGGWPDFLFNIQCGDRLIVTWRDSFERSFLDWAAYAPHPPEGAILIRSGNLLTAAGAAVSF